MAKGIIFLILVCFFSGRVIGKNTGDERPNVLVILTDDQRSTTVGSLEIEKVSTPNIDRLAKKGTLFSNAYILGAPHGAVCSPSRAMLMTGKHYFHLPTSVYAQWSVPKEEKGKCDLLTFPEHFRKNGYTTFATGKQHNGLPWIERGFDQCKAVFIGGMTQHFNTRVSDYSSESGWSKPYRNEAFSSEVFANAAIDFISADKQEKPFLMYVAFTAPHDPRTAPEEFHKMYPASETEVPVNYLPEHPFPIADMRIRDENLAPFPRTKERVQKEISDYHAMITSTDVQIGRILKVLEKKGELENTIVVFSGDNGLALGQHGLMGKQSVYEHSVKVPLIFSGPGIPKNNEVEALAYLHDVFPTLCGLTQTSLETEVDTYDLTQVIKGKQKQVRDSQLYCYNAWIGDVAKEKGKNPEISCRGAHRAIRSGSYKLIVSKKEGQEVVQLFNLENDPFEQNNIATDRSYLRKVKKLKQDLKKEMKRMGDPAVFEENEFGIYQKL